MVAQVRPLLVGFGFVGAILVGGLLMRNVSPSHQDLVVMVLLYAYWSIAWNIIGGMAGQISFGHAVFIGCGPTLRRFCSSTSGSTRGSACLSGARWRVFSACSSDT